MVMKKFAFALVFALSALQAAAQGYPNKPVEVILAFTPGSAVDIVGRIVTAKLSEYWGQPVVNENRSGAGGSIGSAVVARAAPDGYTLLITSNAHTVNPLIYAKLPYDTLKDFTNIVPFTEQPNVMVVNVDAPYKTLGDLVAAAKAKPGALNIGHAGIGSGTHLSTEKWIAASGVKVTEVPFKGTPEVVAAILSHNVDGYWAPISAGLSQIKGGKLRPLAVTTGKRSPVLPDVPTMAEAGIKGGESALWVALWGPAGMPADVVQKINADTRKALADPGVKQKLQSLGNDTMDMSPEQFSKLVRSEMEDYGKVLKFLEAQPVYRLHDVKPVGLHVDHREIGVDPVHAARARQRVGAALDDLARTLLREVLHHHQHLLCSRGEIHRAADCRNRVRAAGVPVGEVARRRDLEGAEHREVEVPAADHAERVGMVEIGAAREQGDRLLAGVDQVLVLLPGGGLRPDAEHAVLAVQDDLAPLGKVVGDQRRQADAEVDVRAFGDVARHARRHLVAIELFHHAAFFSEEPIFTMRFTNIPGVTTTSGSSAPSSTVSRTWVTVHLAAAAMIGAKLRAVLR
jgi:tripartite-type tricarboxylate transporter receptor subunit TctC